MMVSALLLTTYYSYYSLLLLRTPHLDDDVGLLLLRLDVRLEVGSGRCNGRYREV